MEGGGGRRGEKEKRLPANPMIFLSSLPLPLLALFLSSPQFSRIQKAKMLEPLENPTAYGNACYASLPTSQ